MNIKSDIKTNIIEQEEQNFELELFQEVEEFELEDEFKLDKLSINQIRVKRSQILTKLEENNPDIPLKLFDIYKINDKIIEKFENQKFVAKVVTILQYFIFTNEKTVNKKQVLTVFNFLKSATKTIPVFDDGVNENNGTVNVTYFKKDKEGKFLREYDESQNPENKFVRKSAFKVIFEVDNKLYYYWFKGLDYGNIKSFTESVRNNSVNCLFTKSGERIPLSKNIPVKDLAGVLDWEISVFTSDFKNNTTIGLKANNPTLDYESSEILEKSKNAKNENEKLKAFKEFNLYMIDMKKKFNDIKSKI